VRQGDPDAAPGQNLSTRQVKAPKGTLTPSMRIALADLRLDTLLVAYSGRRRYGMIAQVEVVPLVELVQARQGTVAAGRPRAAPMTSCG
jgi:hypothetical protein